MKPIYVIKLMLVHLNSCPRSLTAAEVKSKVHSFPFSQGQGNLWCCNQVETQKGPYWVMRMEMCPGQWGEVIRREKQTTFSNATWVLEMPPTNASKYCADKLIRARQIYVKSFRRISCSFSPSVWKSWRKNAFSRQMCGEAQSRCQHESPPTI